MLKSIKNCPDLWDFQSGINKFKFLKRIGLFCCDMYDMGGKKHKMVFKNGPYEVYYIKCENNCQEEREFVHIF